jgi:hypothetical protein
MPNNQGGTERSDMSAVVKLKELASDSIAPTVAVLAPPREREMNAAITRLREGTHDDVREPVAPRKN